LPCAAGSRAPARRRPARAPAATWRLAAVSTTRRRQMRRARAGCRRPPVRFAARRRTWPPRRTTSRRWRRATGATGTPGCIRRRSRAGSAPMRFRPAPRRSGGSRRPRAWPCAHRRACRNGSGWRIRVDVRTPARAATADDPSRPRRAGRLRPVPRRGVPMVRAGCVPKPATTCRRHTRPCRPCPCARTATRHVRACAARSTSPVRRRCRQAGVRPAKNSANRSTRPRSPSSRSACRPNP